MLYCPKCQSLQPADTKVCDICQESDLREPLSEDLVRLAEVLSSPDAERLGKALSDAGIFFECQEHSSLTADRPEHTVLVRYEAWQCACDLVGELRLEERDNTELSHPEEEETETSKKKLISRIVLFVCFIGIVWAVVALSDTVIAFVKGLFTGG